MIKIEQLCKSFDMNGQPNELFHDLSFEVREGEFLTILGPNGCGKSTLLNIISGVEKVYEGRVIIAGNHKSRSETVAYMLQRDLLLPWLNVTDNINLGLEVQKKNDPENDKKILEYLNILNIAHLQKAYPSNLSGGERQKIALIRTLILATPVLLLDEPFSAIDYNTRLELQRTIFDYANKNGTTVILITHDIDEAIAVSDRILIFDYKPKGIKLDFPLTLDIPDRDPVTTRRDPAFSNYYNLIWQNYPK